MLLPRLALLAFYLWAFARDYKRRFCPLVPHLPSAFSYPTPVRI